MATDIGKTITAAASGAALSSLTGIMRASTPLPGGGLEGVMLGLTGVGDFITSVAESSITSFPTFNQKMYSFMLYLMGININEKVITLGMLGNDAHIGGDSGSMPLNLQRPSYVEAINYANFAVDVDANEKSGVDSTRAGMDELYPDELNSGQIGRRWNLSGNQNSILFKTKKLFNQGKINTLISRFATRADGGVGTGVTYNGQVATQFGESHGRNLLTKESETKGLNGEYGINGYNNPYCRVWTHHYQYDNYNKLIRPAGNGLKNMERWGMFEMNGNGKWGWKSGKQDGWRHSVLNNDTGFLNITPVYSGGGSQNIHTKQCMFSIENLAWKGYDPYSFEKALSWEQRGPLGGRIMWFPPYGITFSETTNAEWNRDVFIGRGEEVFTYKNTRRSGTLSFMLVVDHPSSLDYATWYDKGSNIGSDNYNGSNFTGFGANGLNDNDVHRYFAGCMDENGKSSLMDAVKPTPLTDEAVQTRTEQEIEEALLEGTGNGNGDSDGNTRTISFFAFYPNNYSGMYDMPSKEKDDAVVIRDGVTSEEPHTVDAIAYLLFGSGAQMVTENNGGKLTQKNEYLTLDTDLSGKDIKGYEMLNQGGISEGTDKYIIGNSFSWQNPPEDADSDSGKVYTPDKDKKWYYRIDGEYKFPSGNGYYTNTYGQTLVHNPEDYRDSNSFNMNLNIDNIKGETKFCSDTKGLYSLSEIVYAMMESGQISYDDSCYDELGDAVYSGDSAAEQQRIEYLVDTMSNYKLIGFDCVGYANPQGETSTAVDKRNQYLADGRRDTVASFIRKTKMYKNAETTPKYNAKPAEAIKYDDSEGTNVPTVDVNNKQAKLWRSAKCTLKFSMDDTVSVDETSQTSDASDKFVGYNQTGTIDGKGVYTDESGNRWVATGDTPDTLISYEEYMNALNGANIQTRAIGSYDINNDSTVNKLRYDQEYHFFKQLKKEDEFTYNQLLKTIKYFNPAYHSMTPEGFNARLTFLNQCTRQGDTTSASDSTLGKSANNLAFGRPPFCVLRLGDFFNQLIAIDSINISYLQADGTQWDLNTEGVGVQPMLANVSIQFNFIGGADIAGPVRRLQNAMSFNYYANTSLYDNRADRTVYDESDMLTMGGAGHDQPLVNDEGYYTHTVQKYKKEN